MLFDVDYSVDNCKYEYVAELSFTYLDWRLIEQIEKDDNLDLSSLDA